MVVAAAADGWRAGARRLQIAKRNQAGYPVGTVADAETIAVNTTMNAKVIQGLRTFAHPQKTVTRAFDRGDMQIKGQMFLGVEDFGEGTFEVGGEDEVFDALNNSSGVDVTLATDMAHVPDNSNQVDYPPLFIMSSTRKQLRDGSFWYDNDVYLNTLVRKSTKPGASQEGGESPLPTIYSYVPSVSERLLSGHLFSASTMTVLEDTDTFVKIRSKYPLSWTTFKGNAVATTIQLPYLPVYAGATGAAQNIVTKNGVTTAVTTISTTTGLVTLAAAGTSGDLFIVLYQTNFTPSP